MLHRALFLTVGFAALTATAYPRAARPDEPKPVAAPRGWIVLAVQTGPGSALEGQKKDPYRGTAVLSVDPDTRATETVVEKAAEPRLSADGKTMAYVTAEGLAVRLTDGSSRLIKSVDPFKVLAVVSPDGKETIYGVERTQGKDGRRTFDSWRCAVAGGEPARLPVPVTDRVIDWSPDGKWLLALRWGHGGGALRLYAMRPDGTGERRLGDDSGVMSLARYSPDGKRIVYMHQDGLRNALWVMDADGRNGTKIVDYSPDWHPWACWSPDGKRLAVVDCKPSRDGPPTDFHLDVMDADGRNRRNLKLPRALWMSAPDWR